MNWFTFFKDTKVKDLEHQNEVLSEALGDLCKELASIKKDYLTVRDTLVSTVARLEIIQKDLVNFTENVGTSDVQTRNAIHYLSKILGELTIDFCTFKASTSKKTKTKKSSKRSKK